MSVSVKPSIESRVDLKIRIGFLTKVVFEFYKDELPISLSGIFNLSVRRNQYSEEIESFEGIVDGNKITFEILINIKCTNLFYLIINDDKYVYFSGILENYSELGYCDNCSIELKSCDGSKILVHGRW